MTTVLHQLFPRVEIENYHVEGKRTSHVVWGDLASRELDIHPEELMDYVLQQKHSFVFPKADSIRLIRVWTKEGVFINNYRDFLDELGIQIRLEPVTTATNDNPYLYALQSEPQEDNEWSRLTLLKMWADLRGVSIGAGANKEMVEVAVYGQLSPEFDIELEKLIDATAKDITKAAKYLGRILRPYRYWTMDTPSMEIQHLEVNAFLDGFTASVDHSYCRQQLGVPDPQIGERLEITVISHNGMLKGHGVVGDHDDTDVILFGDQYKRIVRGSKLRWFGVEVLHGSEEAYLDIQTLVNLGTSVFPAPMLQDWITDTVKTSILRTKHARLPRILRDLRVLLRDPSKLSADRWCLRRMARHELHAMLPVMLRKTWAFHRSSIQKLGKLRIAIPGAVRRYVTPDLNGDVKPGSITIHGASFFISGDDAEWFHQLHGGSDSDDSFVIIPINADRALLYRNPNQLGEWSVMRIQDSDISFPVVNELNLPIAQRLNWKRQDLTVNMIMDTVADFWDHLEFESIEVDRALLPRIPESHRDNVRTTEGWLTKLFDFAQHQLTLADEAIEGYSRQMPIPEALITAPRSSYYELAKEFRTQYGKGIRAARNQNAQYYEKHPDDLVSVETDLQSRIEKVHGSIRGQLNKLDCDTQKLVVRDLMRICYLELPGVTTGNGYVLTQANDGILGIGSSKGGRSRGTWDVMIDMLVDQGYGKRLVMEDDRILLETPPASVEYLSDSWAIRVIGGWQTVQTDISATEDERIALAYQTIKQSKQIKIQDRRVIIRGCEFGSIANRTHVKDGQYEVLSAGRPGKALLVQIAECVS